MKGLPVSETATEIDVKAIQQRYSEAWNSHDPDAIAALHTEDTRFCTHGAGPAAAETFAQFPQFASKPIRVLFGSDHWVLEWTMVNADLSVDCVDVIALEDGLVKTKDTYFDFAQLQVAMSALAAG
jgi:SnoaL-like polyketide cyclase.